MNTQNLDNFVHTVMKIQATTAGMGGASNGILGMNATGSETVYDLKAKVVEFASFYRQAGSNKSSLATMANEIEGLLEVLATVAVISEQQCDVLSAELQNLMQTLDASIL
jgi:hypothetical protein